MKLENESQLRLQAIDPAHSFIVQAPAGSGKTELLTQRYLRLLSLVDEPEEIIAITFTRKAAMEMRQRVLNALNNPHEKVLSEHQILTQNLAIQVLVNDKKKLWRLLQNPTRLRILTIDALCAQLSNQMPLLSRIAPSSKISEDAQGLYEKAVQALFKHLDQDDDNAQALKHLLLAMDNHAEKLVELLTAILAQREQWLSLLMAHYRDPDSLREQLEAGLKEVIKENLNSLNQKFHAELKNDLLQLLQFSATHLVNSNENHPLCQWLDLDYFPSAHLEHHNYWRSLAKLLLTEEQNWRKSFDKRVGFPSEAKDKSTKEHFKQAKEQIKALIQNLAQDEQNLTLLRDLLNAPAPHYTEQQWSLLKCIIKILPRLVAELNLVFQAENCIDFVELNLSALRALGTLEQPTELALYLDYQIKHLLIDEFQDTSLVQFKLIEQLTAQWQENEQKSLFLVGDPMQSIYRFRNAEVGLFLRVQQHGIGSIKLQAINLNYNFRADPQLINWLNEKFSRAFPKVPDITSGSIPYSASTSHKENLAQAGVRYYPLIDSTAIQVVKIIQECRHQDP
ncbi:MAG TPA: UvrD-helicase domain-containing protein, partial [Coxiellaceae bacterium]|nr:UvrD-helicase domain-containing protein [Coxiellaceae bacterium]